MGRRVVKEVYTYSGPADAPTGYTLQSKTYFAWQGWTLIAEYDASLALTRRYTFGIDLSGGLGGAGDIGGLLAIEDRRTATAGTYLSAFDGNGNLMGLADGSTGALVAAYEYDPFGNVLRATGTYAKQNPFRFAGKYLDTETGLSYYGFRYYCASTGRFVNRDPLEERGGWNLYSGREQPLRWRLWRRRHELVHRMGTSPKPFAFQHLPLAYDRSCGRRRCEKVYGERHQPLRPRRRSGYRPESSQHVRSQPRCRKSRPQSLLLRRQ
jgi:RHS repeat-associated protein